MARDRHPGQPLHPPKEARSIGVGAKRKLPDDKGMSKNGIGIERRGEMSVALSQVVNPNAAVGQDHLAETAARRCRGVRIAAAHCGQLPRSLAGYESFERMAHKCRALLYTGQFLSVSQEIVIDIDRGPHACLIASIDAGLNASSDGGLAAHEGREESFVNAADFLHGQGARSGEADGVARD